MEKLIGKYLGVIDGCLIIDDGENTFFDPINGSRVVYRDDFHEEEECKERCIKCEIRKSHLSLLVKHMFD